MREQLKVFYNQNANTPLFKQLVDAKAKEIENDSGEKINIEFLLSMISKGYIDENYGDYVTSSYKGLFKKNEFLFLNNLKNNIKPDFNLDVERVEVVIDEIKDYQWVSSSILNNHVLTYIILNGLSEQVSAFIQAIRNYYNDYNENNFIESYINTITESEYLHKIEKKLFGEIEKILLSDSPKKIKLNLLLAFFSEKTGPLFCRMLDYCSVNQLEEYGVVIKEFLIEQKAVLNYALDSATRSDSLKERLNKIDFECEKLSDYKDSILNFLIENAFFVVSKTNLDYILANQDEFQPREYYDYARKHERIKNKVMQKTQIDGFVNLLLDDKEIRISQEGIIDLLFSNAILSDSEKTKQIVNKLTPEYVDLTYLPKVYRNEISFLSDFSSSTMHCLIKQNKVKVDFNNVLYVFKYADIEDAITFAKKQVDRDELEKSVLLYSFDDYAKSSYLKMFYEFLLTEQKVDVDLFEKESSFLTNNGIDILELASSFIKEKRLVSPQKMHALVDLSFKRPNPNNNSINTFLTIVKENFDYFYNNFSRIRTNCYIYSHLKNIDGEKENIVSNYYWILNLSLLLKNDFNILDREQLKSVMGVISFRDLGEATKEWSNEVGIYNTSRILENLIDEECVENWLKKHGKNQVINFIVSIKEYIDYDAERKMNEIAERNAIIHSKSQVRKIVDVANLYKIDPESIIYYKSFNYDIQRIVGELCNNPEPDWEKINICYRNIFMKPRTRLNESINNLFVVGRHFYNSMVDGKIDVYDFLSIKKNALLKHSMSFPLNPILCGAVFEAYFDNKCNLKEGPKKIFFDKLLEKIEENSSFDGLAFVRKCLMPYKRKFIYLPGDSDIVFNVNGNFINENVEINSITCYGVELLALPSGDFKTTISPVRGSDKDLSTVIRQYFSIPKYRIKYAPPFSNYVFAKGRDFIQPLSSIISKVCKQKNLR